MRSVQVIHLYISIISDNRQGALWSCDETESGASKEDNRSPSSASSTDPARLKGATGPKLSNTETRATDLTIKPLTFETETMSQDSGYHGFLKTLEKDYKQKGRYT